MKRLLLYVHFNKNNQLSSHVEYQLQKMKPLFSKVVFISNSQLSDYHKQTLFDKVLVDDIIIRDNIGFDFAAWRDGMAAVGFESLSEYDNVTIMNDTCFGPLWDMKPYFLTYEDDGKVDFWGLTNNRQTKEFAEHIQSYFISFKKSVLSNETFLQFWRSIQDFTDVQDVIKNYETQVTTSLLKEGFRYKCIFNTVTADTSGMLHADFSYYNPTVILKHQVPFIKVKAIDANQSIAPYLLQAIKNQTDYPVDLIVSHMSEIHYPDAPYLLSQKYLVKQEGNDFKVSEHSTAVHLHVFYVDLLEEFLHAFTSFKFPFDLYITTDKNEKESEIKAILDRFRVSAKIVVTGNIGRDVLPMLKLKDELSQYDYIGHFHTKKSKEADFWAGESWRNELIDMLIKPANTIISQFEDPAIGIIIADIPSFFRFNKIVTPLNEHLIAPEMNVLWKKMNLSKSIDFEQFDTFVMSYGTFVWFKYDALKPLFDLDLKDEDVPKEPLPQNSILHAIERLLIYIAWDCHYDFRIAKNSVELTPFLDNKLFNDKSNSFPNTYVDFTYMGGIKGALKYILIGPARAIKYILKRVEMKLKE